MKLKSLLLGSAAALALTSGALAADPRVSFVSLDVCDALGVSGLTIASDDTCLKVSGEVEFDYTLGINNAGPATIFTGSASTNWNVKFEAKTNTDVGVAGAVIRLGDGTAGGDDVRLDEAYVYHTVGGNTLTAGYGFSGYKIANKATDDDASVRLFAVQGHAIQIAQDFGGGLHGAILFDALDSGVGHDGRISAGVGYSEAGLYALLSAGVGNLYPVLSDVPGEEIDWYVLAAAGGTFGATTVDGSLRVGDPLVEFDLDAKTQLDIAKLRAGVSLDYNTVTEIFGWEARAGVTFALTDTLDLAIDAKYTDPIAGRDSAEVKAKLSNDFTEHLTGWVQAGVVFDLDTAPTADPALTAGIGLTYEPGGDFEASGSFNVVNADNYNVKFNAKKSF